MDETIRHSNPRISCSDHADIEKEFDGIPKSDDPTAVLFHVTNEDMKWVPNHRSDKWSNS